MTRLDVVQLVPVSAKEEPVESAEGASGLATWKSKPLKRKSMEPSALGPGGKRFRSMLTPPVSRDGR